ncbi:hypothetical protein E1A91_D10G177400v1 [Gossypium mustelinum]|uniref:Uncharacterized protein n=1 Tax=Gossypium mustelinum TaxID=34275 RepID=A0A5D2T9U6_GOSMU|nr:hypothetical protein E1A91_D10G177400v1 [Gossypium mustelinum]
MQNGLFFANFSPFLIFCCPNLVTLAMSSIHSLLLPLLPSSSFFFKIFFLGFHYSCAAPSLRPLLLSLQPPF